MADDGKSDQAGVGRMAQVALKPGDETAPGTPGTGENICRRCHGTGQAGGGSCPDCGGTGKAIVTLGDA